MSIVRRWSARCQGLRGGFFDYFVTNMLGVVYNGVLRRETSRK